MVQPCCSLLPETQAKPIPFLTAHHPSPLPLIKLLSFLLDFPLSSLQAVGGKKKKE